MAFRPGFHSISVVLILIAFVFLLLATISTPVVSSFNLGKTAKYTYGIFGYCKIAKNVCSSATYPYSLSGVDDSTDNWLLASGTRDTLAKIFILAPIALGFNFILLVVIFIAHFTSKTVIILAIIINIISFLITTIVAVIVIIVFYPNLGWTGWILIGAAACTLISIVFLALSATIGSSDEDVDDQSTQHDLTNFTVIDDKFTNLNSYNNNATSGGFKGPGQAYSGNNTYDTSSSIEKDYEFKQQQSQQSQQSSQQNNVNRPNQPYGNTAVKTVSNSSLYGSKPQTASDFTSKQSLSNPNSYGNRPQPLNNNYYDGGSSSGSKVSVNRQQKTGLPYPSNTQPPVQGDKYPTSVFEHHPEVEGHKPFTELDDYDDDEEESVPLNRANNRTGSNDSDADSDFTSVSQRAVNPNYNNYYGQQQQHNGYYAMQPQSPPGQYPHSQQYQPHFQQGQGYPNAGYGGNSTYQQRAPTVSDNVLSANPDFNIVGPSKRKMQPGFVPVAARYNNNNNKAASSLMGRGGAVPAQRNQGSGPYGNAF
ncbi:SUR7/PalI family-domain-containing protein [Scheffersomyces xylosifermentans]|uniref:SUR7/PalI family-domain-containing protein n=1 Tax=Scheffersomyces xylosifermentans TaxID=1304137 RepID=UPI00315C5FF9